MATRAAGGRGDVDGDPFEEILSGDGPSPVFAPQVRGFDYDGTSINAIAALHFHAFATTGFGVHLDGCDLDGDAFDETATAPGPGSSASYPPRFVGFDYDGATVAAMPGCDVTAPTWNLYGGRVGFGDILGGGGVCLITGAGPDPSAAGVVRPYAYQAGSLIALLAIDAQPGLG